MNNKNEKGKVKIKVAWYENNRNFIEPILYYLKKMEVFDVEIWESPEIAEKNIEKSKPDLIIFDYRMPNLDGVKMFKQLKDKFSFVTVFFSIWANDEVTRAEIIEAGVESSAIFDKHIEPTSFPKALYEYYMSKKGKKNK
jgi:DNA-binding response OmpR family regulator